MNIEEAIDILKNSIADYVIGDYCEKCADNKICEDRNEDCYYIQAIENLIARYKKLEEENKHLREYIAYAPNLDEMTATKYQLIQREGYINGVADAHQRAEQIIHENYIPKSKVHEKIEDLEKRGYFEEANAMQDLLEES